MREREREKERERENFNLSAFLAVDLYFALTYYLDWLLAPSES